MRGLARSTWDLSKKRSQILTLIALIKLQLPLPLKNHSHRCLRKPLRQTPMMMMMRMITRMTTTRKATKTTKKTSKFTLVRRLKLLPSSSPSNHRSYHPRSTLRTCRRRRCQVRNPSSRLLSLMKQLTSLMRCLRKMIKSIEHRKKSYMTPILLHRQKRRKSKPPQSSLIPMRFPMKAGQTSIWFPTQLPQTTVMGWSLERTLSQWATKMNLGWKVKIQLVKKATLESSRETTSMQRSLSSLMLMVAAISRRKTLRK